MKPNHSQTIRTLVSPTHNHHRTRNTSKSNQFDLRRLAGVHHRQAVQPKTQNLCCNHVSPGGQGCAARRFLFRNPKTSTKMKCRLVVIHHPPSGFWKNSRNSRITWNRQNTCIQFIVHRKQLTKWIKITEFNSPNLNSSLWNWLLTFCLGSTMIFSLASTQPHVAAFPFSQLAQCMLC